MGPNPSIDAAIARAVAVLRAAGAQEVWVFGSAARGTAGRDSDLDLAVRGLPPEQFFRAVGDAMAASGCPIDLIDLNQDTPMTRYLQQSGVLRRVA